MTKEKLKSYLSQIKPDRWDCDILCEMIDNLTDKDIIGLLSKNKSCESCKFFHQNYLCLELGTGNIKPKEIGLKYCDRWELK